jgi:polyhydroxyalkanoate synthase
VDFPVLLWVLGAALGAWVVAAAGLAWWARWTPRADGVHAATTDDGWRLALYELRPETTTAGLRPLILCHGILMSRYAWLAPDGIPSLARELCRLGHWVWVVELRGSGASLPPAAAPRWDYGFLDYVERDLPSLVDEVRRQTGARWVDWIGHSMGGMIMYARLARHGAEGVCKVVTLGTPVRLGGRPPIPRRLGIDRLALGALRSVHVGWPARIAAPLFLHAGSPLVRTFMHPAGLTPRLAMGISMWGTQRTSTRLLLEFRDWMQRSDPWLSAVSDAPAPHRVPPGGLLALHGRADRLATPANVQGLQALFPEARIEAAEGESARPFGHNDLLIGPPELRALAARIDAFLRDPPPTEAAASQAPQDSTTATEGA